MSADLAVLVVDDYPDTADTLGWFLRAQGFDARQAHSGDEALTLLNGWQPDAAVLDLMMPGMDGLQLAERLCAAPGRRPLLVAVSGTIRPDLLGRVTAAGFDRHFLKPIDPCELAAVLQEHARSLREAAAATRAEAARLKATAEQLQADAARLGAGRDQVSAEIRDRRRSQE